MPLEIQLFGMQRKAHGAQRHRQYTKYGDGSSTALSIPHTL
jgi:hypothetical protein